MPTPYILSGISYVGSGLTLIAFVTAITYYAYREYLRSLERRIEAAPGSDRAALISKTLELLHVDPEGLTQAQRFKIVLEQLKQRQRRHTINAVAALLAFAILAAVSIVAILNGGDKTPKTGGDTTEPAHLMPDIALSMPRSTVEKNIGTPDRVHDPDQGPTQGRQMALYWKDNNYALEIAYKNDVVVSYSILALSENFPLYILDKDLRKTTFDELGGEPADFAQSSENLLYGQQFETNTGGNPIEYLAYVSFLGSPYNRQVNPPALDIPSKLGEYVKNSFPMANGIMPKIADNESISFLKSTHPNGFTIGHDSDGLIAGPVDGNFNYYMLNGP